MRAAPVIPVAAATPTAGLVAPVPPAEPQVLRCTTTSDFLAALPRLVGFTAPNSLFLVLFRGSRAAHTLRVDLPADETPATLRNYLTELQTHLRRVGALTRGSSPAAVISSERTFADAAGTPWRTLALLLERRFERSGVKLRELCCLAPDGWVSFFEPAPPPHGHPLSTIRDSAVAAAEPVPQLRALSTFPDPPELLRLAVAQSLGDDARDPLSASEGVTLLSRPALEAPDIARLVRFLASESGWTAAFDSLRRAAATARKAYGVPVPNGQVSDSQMPNDHASATQTRDRSASPASKVAASELRLAAIRLREMVPLAPPRERPMIIALSALVWWFRGFESIAQAHIGQGLTAEPEHRVSLLVQRMISTGNYALSSEER